MKVAYLSNYKDLSGYSYAAEGYIKSLISANVDVVTRNVSLCDKTRDISFTEEEKGLQDIDICIVHSLPDFLGKINCGKVISLFAWETTKLPDEWVKKINKYATNVVVPNSAEKTMFGQMINKPIVNIPHAFSMDSFSFDDKAKISGIDSNSYVFYTMGELNARKNLDSIVFSYLCEFSENDNVVLFIHSPSIDGRSKDKVLEIIEHIKIGLKKKSYPKIIISSKYVDDKMVNNIHALGDSYISLSKGESWNIPLFYAYAFGNNCISTKCSGPLEYIEDKEFFVDSIECPCFGMSDSPQHLYSCNGLWQQANVLSVQNKMREQYSAGKNKNKSFRDETICKYSYASVGEMFKEYLCNL